MSHPTHDPGGTVRRTIPTDPDALLTVEEVSALTGLPIGTLNNARVRGELFEHVKLGRSVRYRRGTIMEYVAKSARQSTDSGRAA